MNKKMSGKDKPVKWKAPQSKITKLKSGFYKNDPKTGELIFIQEVSDKDKPIFLNVTKGGS